MLKNVHYIKKVIKESVICTTDPQEPKIKSLCLTLLDFMQVVYSGSSSTSTSIPFTGTLHFHLNSLSPSL